MKFFAILQLRLRRLTPLFALVIAGLASPATFAVTTYTFHAGTAALVPGTTDTGSNCDDCLTAITLPFSFSLYGTGYSTLNAGANGSVQFTGNATYAGSDALPDSHFANTILAMQNDLRTDQPGGGIFTSVSGVAPHRIFNIEWRAVLFSNPGSTVNFEVRLFEGLNWFEIIYGAIAVNGAQQTVGVQMDNTDFTQFENNTGGTLFAGLRLVGAMATTAASVSIGGRVLTANGTPVDRAQISLTATNGATVFRLTNPFGYYRFDEVTVGEIYVLTVVSKRYSFTPQVVSVTGELTALDLTAEP